MQRKGRSFYQRDGRPIISGVNDSVYAKSADLLREGRRLEKRGSKLTNIQRKFPR